MQLTPFPWERALIEQVYLPHAAVLGWIVILGELLVGVGLLTATRTHLALLGGLFMNLNFVAAGAPTPNAFYIVMQLALLFHGQHALSLERALPWQSEKRAPWRLPLGLYAGGVVASVVLGAVMLTYGRDFTPSGSVEDPAILLAVMAFYTAGYLSVMALRHHPDWFRQWAAGMPPPPVAVPVTVRIRSDREQ
ncbi:hypothetical protein [Deinococcus arenicola]|uniref:DoxX family protein n=1 Tax=Deinococcus arenicola TaxID=2994950 RepID=A0ABU4DVZ4_9DEIO|nr:hypothetical protein [Deinococcus sp. ZS9-10]MDV6376607.1 hypothetical protein [Deinococcus sp. ZS9-10]